MSIRRTSAHRHVPMLFMLLLALFSFSVKVPTTVPTTHEVTSVIVVRASTTVVGPLATSPHGH